MKTTIILLAIFSSIICNSQIKTVKSENIENTLQKFQTVPLFGTEVRQLNSEIVEGMEYKLFISLPDNYESSVESYPVLYFLDAWAQFGIIRQAYWLLRFYNEVPNLIIVGIAYDGNANDHVYNRARDYTPTKIPPEKLGRLGDFTPVSGGAPIFIEFLEKELFPFIEKEYKADKSDRAIFGVSYGGLFGAFALFNHTDLFQRYFIGSPPIWWDNEIILQYESEYANNNKSLPVKVFLAIGGAEDSTSYNNLKKRLLSRKYDGLDFTSTIFENETHMSVIPAAHTRALRILYSKEE